MQKFQFMDPGGHIGIFVFYLRVVGEWLNIFCRFEQLNIFCMFWTGHLLIPLYDAIALI